MSLNPNIKKVKPSEIYNLAAQSHVQVSFEIPEYTANSDAIGVLRLLEAVCVQHEIDHLNGMRILDRIVDTTIRVEKKPGRNEPCHCGSGKKYKKCCLRK